jgi:hypothetical protein
MEKWSNYRLMVIGAKAQVRQFQDSGWGKGLGARHGEWLENSPSRFVCEFETDAPPLDPLRILSRHWPGLILLLDYEEEEKRIKGLAKAAAGQIAHCQFEY